MEAGCYFTFYIEWTSLIVLVKFCYFEKSQMSFTLSKRGRIFESPKSQLCVTCYKSDRHYYHEWASVTFKRVRYVDSFKVRWFKAVVVWSTHYETMYFITKIHLNRLVAVHFLTLHDPYFGNHWFSGFKPRRNSTFVF